MSGKREKPEEIVSKLRQLAVLQPTTGLTIEWRFLARGAAACSGAAALTGVFRAGTRLDAPA